MSDNAQCDPCTNLSNSEKEFVDNVVAQWKKPKALRRLERDLLTAVHIELATIPIYLYTYYSINRKEKSGENIRPIDLYANKAGALIMSVAVEEMLHMSLSSNIYYSLTGKPPELYLKSPGPYPTGLPYHNPVGPPGPEGKKRVQIPLAKLSYEQLWHFLQIEYPEEPKEEPDPNDPSKTIWVWPKPKDRDWNSIGQFYSYIRCLICAPQLDDSDFQKGDWTFQIQPYNYSPNNVDTVHPTEKFDPWKVPGKDNDSAAAVADFANQPDSHAGPPQLPELITVSCRADALEAIRTVCDQGEGYPTKHGPEPYDDPSKKEGSHYYKFLSLQAQLEQYDPNAEGIPQHHPKPPAPAEPPITDQELYDPGSGVIINFPDNPKTIDYPEEYRPLSDLCNGIYQYMLILTETIFKVQGPNELDAPPEEQKQKRFFNQAMHNTMIWILDKLVQKMRQHSIGNCEYLAATFENLDLGGRADAYANLMALAAATEDAPYYSDIEYYVDLLKTVPDVSEYWLSSPGPGQPIPEPYRYEKAPTYPTTIGPQPDGLPRHACMGLNSCKGSDRFGLTGPPDGPTPWTPNDCAGQGFCSTAGPGATHSCHVKNDCKNQGGCGLYGTAEELDNPGHNECKSLGSCATPINAERFSTNGPNQGKSVWLRAREVFHQKLWPELQNENPDLPDKLPPIGGPEFVKAVGEDLFKDGPPYIWMSDDNEQRGNFTACGQSGMSGAGGCV